MRFRPTIGVASCSATEGRVHVRSRACRAAAPNEYRHHRRGADVQGAAGRQGAGGPVLGEIEEYFVSLLRPGDTFMFAGRLLRFLAHARNDDVSVPKAATASRWCRHMRAAGCR